MAPVEPEEMYYGAPPIPSIAVRHTERDFGEAGQRPGKRPGKGPRGWIEGGRCSLGEVPGGALGKEFEASMRAPESLATLLDYGIIQEVIRPLMSGKEAQVYVVVVAGDECVAKVYKAAEQRTFKHRSDYTEGRRTRNTRDQRAMSKRSQHGRQKDEDAWRTTEVEMIYRLRDAGVRVPEPINFVDGVLVMEFVKDADGHAAPRLGDLSFSASEAREIYHALIREVVRMLCAGVIHGDLSDFNVLMGTAGPVLIDFPQAVDPSHNPKGRDLLLRDVQNLHRFLARFAPDEPVRRYGEEIWSLFQENKLQPDTKLSGGYRAPKGKTDTEAVKALIDDASRDEHFRRHGRETDDDEDLELPVAPLTKASAPVRKVVDFTKEAERHRPAGKRAQKVRGSHPARPRRGASGKPVAAAAPAGGPVSGSEGAAKSRRRGRGRRGTPKNGTGDGGSTRESEERAPRSESAKVDAARPGSSQRRRRRGRGRTQGTDQPNAAATAPAGKNPQPNPRQNPRANAKARSNPKTTANPKAKPGAGRAGAANAGGPASGRSRGKTTEQRDAKRPTRSESSSSSARAPGETSGSDRPPRRRRRRPRKSTPE